MPPPPRLTLATLALLVGTAAMASWLFVRLADGTGAVSLPPVGAALMVATILAANGGLGLAQRRGVARTLVQINLSCLLGLTLIRFLPINHLDGCFWDIVGLEVVALTLSDWSKPDGEGRERSIWGLEVCTTVAGAIQGTLISLIALIVAIIGLILLALNLI